MSLSVDGVWKAGVWATTVWANGVWREGAPPPPVVVVATDHGAGGGGRKKKRLFVEQHFDHVEPKELVEEVQAVKAHDYAEEILSSNREIARIKTMMRLSSKDEALKAMETEIVSLEKHLLELKHEQEDFLLLTILM